MKTASASPKVRISNARIAYYSLWNEIFQKFEIRGKERDKLRHEIEFEALGVEKSSKNFNKRDFDVCFSVARQLLKNGEISISASDADADAEEGERRRYIFAIRNVCECNDYIAEISNDKFGVLDWTKLNSGQLWQLLITLKNRMRAKSQKRQTADDPF